MSQTQYLVPGSGDNTGNRSTTEFFLAGGAIAIGDAVTWDDSQTGANRTLYVIEAETVATVGNPGVIGVAKTAAAAAGDVVEVYTKGYCPTASVAAATVAGSALIGPIGTAGQLAIEVPGTTTGRVFAVAAEADTANFAPIFIL
jgi:hypothetical protein